MKTILIVDDFATMRKFLSGILQFHGYLTVEAEDIAGAISCLGNERSSVDLVLTDFLLRRETGYELLKRIRTETVNSEIPLLFMSTEQYPARLLAKDGLKFSGWIRKPVDPDLLLSKVETSLQL